jgi:L-serine/L-threonine ammonia-lyase
MAELYIKTPLIESLELSERIQSQVYLKMEAFQPSGSFKNRGIGFICSHFAEVKKAKCFVSSSGGNAGLAVAYSGRLLNVPVKVVVPRSSPQMMVEKIQREGAQVTIHGEDWNAADILARQLALEPDHFYISPFDHPLIWKGHASLVHEIKESGVKPDAIIVAVGGGGLLCGVAQGLQEVGWMDVPLFTAETEGAASFALSVKEKKLITLDSIKTLATSLGAKTVTKQALEWNKILSIFPQIISDKQAVEACLQFADQYRILVEPACGAALSLIYERKIDPHQHRKIVVIVCGGSGVTRALMQEWITKTTGVLA